MTQQAERTLETMSGKVSQVAHRDGKATGIKLEGREDAWLNFTKYPRGPMEIPNQGDNVKLGVELSDKGSWFIMRCEIQHHAQPAAFEDGQVPAGGRDLATTRRTAVMSAAEMVSAMIRQGVYDDVPRAEIAAVASIDARAIAEDFERLINREEMAFE